MPGMLVKAPIWTVKPVLSKNTPPLPTAMLQMLSLPVNVELPLQITWGPVGLLLSLAWPSIVRSPTRFNCLSEAA